MKNLRDNFLGTLNRQGFDSVPLDMSLCPSQLDAFKARFGHKDYAEYFGFAHRGVWIELQRQSKIGRDLFERENLPDKINIDDWGVGHSKGSDAALHMTRMHHPLRGDISLQELQAYPYPSINFSNVAKCKVEVESIHKAGFAATGGMACTIWETAWYMRSMEDLMSDMMTGDERAVYHLDRVTAVSCDRARAFAQAGIDLLQLGDDIGTQRGPMLSVPMWEEWLKVRLKKVISAAREVNPSLLVFYHSCGDVTEFIEGLIDAGVDILNPVQPECMDFDAVYERADGKLSFWGTIGTQNLLPFGTPQDIRNDVRRKLQKCGDRGGIVIAPTHLVEPEVPWENLVAMCEAAKEFSRV